MAESETAYLCSVLLALCGLLATAAMHALGYMDQGTEWGIFEHELQQTWDSYQLRILSSDWLFYIWMVLYALQILWIFYGLIALCKETKAGMLAAHPPIMPSMMYVTMLCGLACTLGWVVVFDTRTYVAYSILACSAASIFYTITLGLSVHAVKKYSSILHHQGNACDVTYIQMALHNAVGALSAWLPCISFYVTAIILHAKDILERDTAQYVTMGITMSYFLIWMLADIFGFGAATSHIISPYLVYILVFIMPLYENWAEENRDKLFTVSIILTCVSGFLILAKLSINCGRACSPQPTRLHDEFEGGAVEYQEPEYEYDKEHDNSQLGLVNY